MKKSIIISFAFSQLLFFVLFPVLKDLFTYLHPIVLFVVWICLTLVVFFIVFFIRNNNIFIPPVYFYLFMIIYSCFLIVLLFYRPSYQTYMSINLIPFETILFYLSGKVNILIAVYNLVANIGLFIPYGILLCVLNKKLLSKWLLSVVFITIIEVLQYITHRGAFDVDDLLLNVVGVWVGIWLYPIVSHVIRFRK